MALALSPPSVAMAIKRSQGHAMALESHPWGMTWPRPCAHACYHCLSGSAHARALAACPQQPCCLLLKACQHAPKDLGYLPLGVVLAFAVACLGLGIMPIGGCIGLGCLPMGGCLGLGCCLPVGAALALAACLGIGGRQSVSYGQAMGILGEI